MYFLKIFMNPEKNHEDDHTLGIGGYIKDIVYGASDGIITTFAIVTGSLGANLPPSVILALGFANLIADGFSMGASNFLGSRSENALYHREAKKEHTHTEKNPQIEKAEVEVILREQGFGNTDVVVMTEKITANRAFWVDFMMKYEHDMATPDHGDEWRGALATFVSFVVVGSLPILPYVFLADKVSRETYSIVATALALFGVGAARYFVTRVNWFVSGIEMLFVGGAAAAASYAIGALVSGLI